MYYIARKIYFQKTYCLTNNNLIIDENKNSKKGVAFYVTSKTAAVRKKEYLCSLPV